MPDLSNKVPDLLLSRQPSVTPQQPAGAALQAAPSRSSSENVASSVEQTCLEAITPVANRVRKLENSIPCMSFANDHVLERLRAMERTLQAKAELLRSFVDDADTLRGEVNGLFELEFAIRRSVTRIEQAISFGCEVKSANQAEESN